MEEDFSVDESQSDEALQQLRNWQLEQKKRLMEQQQHARLLLMEKQKKLLSMISSVDPNGEEQDESAAGESHRAFGAPKEGDGEDCLMALTSPTSVDDVPLKRPRAVRTFSQLLETSLNSREQEEENSNQEAKQTRKFPFLKKGQGISRFGPLPKPRKTSRVAASRLKGKENRAPLPPATRKPAQTLAGSKPRVVATKAVVVEPVEPMQQQQVVCYQPEIIEEVERDGNISRNEEDLAVFELLERFATINASFSSSSSLIGQLIDKGVTHLPSPSKFISFLSKRRDDVTGCEDGVVSAHHLVPKSQKNSKHVRFAESVEDEDDYNDRPWLADISPDASSGQSQPSPYVSNTMRIPLDVRQETSKKSAREPVDLDETPTSPIGFPDYEKLFGNPARSLWTNEEPSTPRNEDGPSVLTKFNPANIDLKADTVLPSSLPMDDPRTVYQNSLLRSRLATLEREIATYRKETDGLRRAKKEQEESKLKLEQEQEKFRRYTENEKRRLQLLYTEEQKRVRTEQLKDLPFLKENEQEIDRLKEELKQVREEHRQKENKWMASQTKMQEKIRSLEVRNRELGENLDKSRTEEQNLRRRLNASLRPGAAKIVGKSDSAAVRPGSPKAVCSSTEKEEGIKSAGNPLAPSEPPTTADQMKSPQDCNPAGTGGVTHTVLPDGTKLMIYPNGNRKEIWPDGKGTQVIYYNGDIKQKLADGSVIYTYADSGTKHTTKPDGTEILEFSSGQIETTYPDGRSQVQYLGGATKMKYPDGREEAQWPDGTKLWTDGKGHGVMTFPSGMREIYTPICKRREYPDGTVKTVYEDGRSETRYSNGRIRVKDSDGKIITDTGEVTIPK